MSKETYNPSYGKLLIVIIIAVIDLLVTIYLKYSTNGESVYNFRLDYLGNILNIAINGFLLITITMFITVKSDYYSRNVWIILVFSVIYIAPLILLVYLNKMGITFQESSFFDYPFKKILVAALHIGHSAGKVFTIFIIWGMILGSGKLLLFRSLFHLILTVLLLCSISFLYTFNYRVQPQLTDVNVRYEVGVVLGAAVWQKNEPSPLFKGRIHKAKEFYNNKKISKIQLTGGNAPGELSEAQTAFNYLLELGIPAKNIWMEEETSTTSEQVKFIKKDIIQQRHIEEVIIVSDSFHLARINEMCKFFRVNAVTAASDYSLNWEKLLYYRIRDSIGLLLFWLYAI